MRKSVPPSMSVYAPRGGGDHELGTPVEPNLFITYNRVASKPFVAKNWGKPRGPGATPLRQWFQLGHLTLLRGRVISGSGASGSGPDARRRPRTPGAAYRHGREPTEAAANLPIHTHRATTIPTPASRPASSSSLHRARRCAPGGWQGQSVAVTRSLSLRWTSAFVLYRAARRAFVGKNPANLLQLRRGGPLLLPARLRPQSQEGLIPGAPGA